MSCCREEKPNQTTRKNPNKTQTATISYFSLPELFSWIFPGEKVSLSFPPSRLLGSFQA